MEAKEAEVRERTGVNVPPAHKLILHTLAEAALRASRDETCDTAWLLVELSTLPAYWDLFVELDVPLDELFTLEGVGLAGVVSVLSQRMVDAVVYAEDGTPLCALRLPEGGSKTFAPKLFEMTGIPLITVPQGLHWRDGMERVDRAFGTNIVIPFGTAA
ncbi:hypothetical protein [Jannaschia aquimarina]|nr:hypothetical protein [Jannaschia aquimarina]